MKESGKVLTGLSHEIRSYMNAIVGFSFLIEQGCMKDGVKTGYCDKILQTCTRLVDLLENYFDSALIDNKHSTVSIKPCSLNRFLDNIISEFEEALDHENSKNIVISAEKNSSDLTEVYIDCSKVFRAIRCLLQNAVNNMVSGQIKIGYRLRDNNVIFYILDPEQDYEKCREFLYSEDMDISLSRYFDTASAVNMILARKIVSLLEGKIWIDHFNINGTGIYISVPVKAIDTSGLKDEKSSNRLPSRVLEPVAH